jgi:hypothetical protein
MSIEREKPWNSGQNPNVPASETKPQTLEQLRTYVTDCGFSAEWTRENILAALDAGIAAQAALRAEMERERAEAVVAGEEAAIEEFFTRIISNLVVEGNWKAAIKSARAVIQKGALARALDQARVEAVAPVQASLEAQAIETGRILAREKALRERLEGLTEIMKQTKCEHDVYCHCDSEARAWADQLRAALEETK